MKDQNKDPVQGIITLSADLSMKEQFVISPVKGKITNNEFIKPKYLK